MPDVPGRPQASPLVRRLRPFTTTIFAEMTELSERLGAVNLGQGFPDSDGPPAMLRAARDAIAAGVNQYPPGPGSADLRAAIAEARLRDHGQELDPSDEVLVTVGATEAVAAAMIALCEPGDEVILVEPYYDSYPAAVAMAGARHLSVPLRPGPDGRLGLDAAELAAAVTDRTRLVLLNTPHNPTGTVLTRAELEAVAAVCRERDLLVVTDEVYERLVYDGERHVPMATLPGMAERTLTISSAGKTFSATGWKIGWACGPAPLVAAVRAAKQFITYVGGAPFQPAVAHALRHESAWVAGLRAELAAARDRLSEGLRAAGLAVRPARAAYFALADIRPLGLSDGMAFCRELPARAGVAAIPVEVFCDRPAEWSHLVRFAFCKRAAVIDEAVARLEGLSG
ncbi:MAG: pyridoxal phosphate-dependent aminotransferase [Thermoleophilia bacterium]